MLFEGKNTKIDRMLVRCYIHENQNCQLKSLDIANNWKNVRKQKL